MNLALLVGVLAGGDIEPNNELDSLALLVLASLRDWRQLYRIGKRALAWSDIKPIPNRVRR